MTASSLHVDEPLGERAARLPARVRPQRAGGAAGPPARAGLLPPVVRSGRPGAGGAARRHRRRPARARRVTASAEGRRELHRATWRSPSPSCSTSSSCRPCTSPATASAAGWRWSWPRLGRARTVTALAPAGLWRTVRRRCTSGWACGWPASTPRSCAGCSRTPRGPGSGGPWPRARCPATRSGCPTSRPATPSTPWPRRPDSARRSAPWRRTGSAAAPRSPCR